MTRMVRPTHYRIVTQYRHDDHRLPSVKLPWHEFDPADVPNEVPCGQCPDDPAAHGCIAMPVGARLEYIPSPSRWNLLVNGLVVAGRLTHCPWCGVKLS